jgi:hypothetical protein
LLKMIKHCTQNVPDVYTRCVYACVCVCVCVCVCEILLILLTLPSTMILLT